MHPVPSSNGPIPLPDAGGAGGGSSWEWGLTVDATSLSNHDFLGATPGSYTLEIEGVDHVLELPASCSEADIVNGSGFVLKPVAGTLPSTGYTNPPRLSLAIVDVFADYDPDRDQLAFQWVATNDTDVAWSGAHGWIEKAADSLITAMSGFGDGFNGGDVAYALDEGTGTTTFAEGANRAFTTMLHGPGDAQMRSLKNTAFAAWTDPLSVAYDSKHWVNPQTARSGAVPANPFTSTSRLCLGSTSHTLGNTSTFAAWRVGRLRRAS